MNCKKKCNIYNDFSKKLRIVHKHTRMLMEKHIYELYAVIPKDIIDITVFFTVHKKFFLENL